MCLPGEIGKIVCSAQLLRMDSVRVYCPRSAHKCIGVIRRGVHTSKVVRKSYGQHTGIDATEESCPGHAQLM